MAFLVFSTLSTAMAQVSLGVGATYQFLPGTNNLSNQGFFVQFDQDGLLIGSRIEAGLQGGNNPGFNLKAAVLADLPLAAGFRLKVGAGPELVRDTQTNNWAVNGYVFASPEYELALGFSAFAEVAYSKVLYTQVATPDGIAVKAGIRFSF
ncbi:hypothetical protein GCM10008938_14400 [Deinococcus roseus]|uniref:Outer membrane protein beta-barrel domain-containing protein n=2 Tax=Deinococcus roseus TaxID=392414 RepID=A0ABQ2CX78_9DEIO|nr:hypothetical protein GCM10008938_14400 [Deinococcus roseus]